MRIFWSSISSVISGLVFILLSPLIYSKMGDKNFSFFAFFISIATILSVLDFGLSKGICFINARLISTHEKRYLLCVQKAIFLLNICLCVLSILLIGPYIFHSYLIEHNYGLLFLIAICLALFCTNNTLKASYEGENKFFKSCIVRVFAVIALWLPALILKKDQWLAGGGVCMTSVLLFCPLAIKLFSRENLEVNILEAFKVINKHKDFIFLSFACSVCIVLTNYLDRLILFQASKTEDFNIYFVISEFFLKLLIPSTIISSLLFRDIIYFHSGNQIDKIKKTIVKSSLITLFVSVMALFIIYFFKSDIFCKYFKIHSDLSLIIIVFGAGITLNSIAAIFSTSLEALGLQKKRLQIFILSVPFNCFLCFILVLKMGIFGAVLYWFIKSLVELLLFSVCVFTKLKSSFCV